MRINSKARERRRRLGIVLLVVMIVMALLGTTKTIVGNGLSLFLVYWTLFAIVSIMVVGLALRDMTDTRFRYSLESKILAHKLRNGSSSGAPANVSEKCSSHKEEGDTVKPRE
ncbi:hypothetical protein ACFL1X_13220 [Candidatus Hydrogenedentota bacterium]